MSTPSSTRMHARAGVALEGGPLVVTTFAKGGAGKSTSTIGLGEALAAQTGWRVRLVDLDPQATLTEWGAPGAEFTVADVLGPAAMLGRDVAVGLGDRLDLLPANDGLADVQPGFDVDAFGERIVLDAGEDGVDVILVDTRASGPLAPDARLLRAALDAADVVLAPFEAGTLDPNQARALRQVLADVAAYGQAEEREVPTLLLPTRVPPRRLELVEGVVEMMQAVSDRRFLHPIREHNAVARAARRHRLLGVTAPAASATKDYAAAAEVLAATLVEVSA